MAPLTWRNVDAPDLSKASQILNQSATMLGNAGDGISGTLTDIRNRQRRDRSAAVLPELAKVANEQGVGPALAQIGNMISPQDMTPELQQAMLNLRSNALNYESSRASTTSTRDSNNRLQQTHDLEMRQKADLARLTPAIVRAREDVTGLYGNGAPASSGAPVAGGPPLSEREMLARTIMAEAGGEGYQGMLGVGSVIANRVRAGRYGNSFRDVIMAPGQFSAWNSVTGYAKGQGGLDMNNMRANADAYRAADAIISGQYEDITGGATHYYNDKVATPKWGIQAGGNWGRIGNHVFGVPAGEQGVPSNAGPLVPGSNTAPQAPASGGGTAARELERVSSLLGNNTSLTPDMVLGFIDGNLTTAVTAEDQAFKREEKANERADRLKKEQELALQREAMNYVQTKWGGFSPENPQDTLNQIYADENLSTEQKTAYATAVKKFYEDNPTNFDLSGNASVPEEMSAGLSSIRDSATYMQTTDKVARLVQAADNTEDGRSPVEVIGAIKESLGEDVTVSVPDFLDVVNAASNKYGLDPNMVARVAETMIVGGGFFGEDVALDRANLMAQLDQTFGDGQSWSNARNMVRNNQAYLDQADKLESKISQLTQTRQFWAEPGRDPEKAQQNFERIDGELAEAKKALRDLVRRASNDRTSFDETRNRANPAGRPGVTTAAQSVDAAFQKLLQGEGSMEDFLISAVEAGDPDATAQVKQALIDQGVDPDIAENSTMLRKLIKDGVISLVQNTDNMLSDAYAFAIGRPLGSAARGLNNAYSVIDPQGATKVNRMLNFYDQSMDSLTEEGFIADGPRRSEAAPVQSNNEAAGSEITYQQWRQMSRSERKKAGLPESEIGGQIYFNRFLAGLR